MTSIQISFQTFLSFIFAICMYWVAQGAHANIFNTGNKSISYQDVGQGNPLVLIHAFPTDQRLFTPQLDGLNHHFRVITLDLWGFGQSSKTNGEAITMSQYADQVKQLLEHLKIQKAIIGGESMGGYIALAFLEKYPTYVSGLILSNTQSIPDNKEAKANREKTAQEVLLHGKRKLINNFMPKALTQQASRDMQQLLQNILESQSNEGIASALRGMALRSDTSNLLSTTQLPILIITGEEDHLISPKQSENMHRGAQHSKLLIIKKVAHLSSLEKSREWNQAVITMFQN